MYLFILIHIVVQIGVLDVDICGPSLPLVFGVQDENVSIFWSIKRLFECIDNFVYNRYIKAGLVGLLW